MKNKPTPKTRNVFYTLRIIIGTLMAISGFAIFILSAMVNIIEPSTFNILGGIALMIVGLLIANSMKVIQFLQDMS